MPISCDTEALAALARCFSCLSPVTLQEIQTYLLCQLANSGGGGGGGETFITSGAADPVADPGIAAAMYINTTTYSAWEWNDAAGAWRMFYSGAKVYRALLTQSSTNAPVATVLENTLGGTVVWTRDDIGSYFATLAGAFTANKTFPRTQIAYPADALSSGFIGINWASANVVRVTSADGTLNLADDIMTTNTPVEILVYP